MANLERRLKDYYENNFDYEPGDTLAERILALESSPAAAPKRRRRYVLPIAAALALAVGISGWAIFHRPKPEQTQVQAPEVPQSVSVSVQNGTDDQAELSKAPVPEKKKPAAPKPQAPVEEIPAPAQQPEQTNTAYNAPAAPERSQVPPDVPAEDPAPEPPEEAAPEPPEEQPAVIPDDPTPPEPPEPDPPAEEPPQTGPEEPPQTDPAPEEPPHEDPPEEPQIIHLEEHDIDASYRMKGGRETLTLMSHTTGERVELDVTGWQEELQEAPSSAPDDLPPDETPSPSEAASTYTGRNSIVDFIFDKNIVFYLILEEDGTVRVKLDVTDAEA